MKDEEKGAIPSEEKEVEELARAMCPFSKDSLCRECSDACFYKDYAKRAIDKGYRKQSEWISVEVVRCKDCTHFQTVNGRTLCSINAKRGEKLWLGLRATVEDGFCHHGEKMKGGADQ